MSKEYFDMNWEPLEAGQTVEVKHCVGRYGETAVVVGTLQKIDEYGGLTVALNHRHSAKGYQGIVQPYSIGDDFYVTGVFTYDFDTGNKRGYKKHDDYEHGHEAHVKIIPDLEVAA